MPLTPLGNSQAKLINEKQLRRDLELALELTAREVNSDLTRTGLTWKKPPTFKMQKESSFAWVIETNNEIWIYLNDGTPPHIIRPKKAKILRFQRNYNPKTSVGTFGSKQGGASGDFVLAREVNHPGTAARQWIDKASAEAQKRLNIRVDAALGKI